MKSRDGTPLTTRLIEAEVKADAYYVDGGY